MAFRLLSACLLLAAGASALSAQSVERTYQRACDNGEVRDCVLLGLIYETGAGDNEPDVARALELYRRACELGIEAGCTRLAVAQQAPPTASREEGYVRVGYIADAETGEPVADAVVEIERLRIRVLADGAGRVDLGALPRGRHTVAAGRLGYERVEGELPVPWERDFLMLLDRLEPSEEDTHGGIFGRVIEEGTGRELAYVDVTLDAESPIQLVTGPDGRFSVGGLEPGQVDVTFALIGYAPRTTTLNIQPGQTLEVRASLSTQVIELAPIEVVVGSGYLQRTGFYRRTRNSIGYQLSRSQLREIDPLAMSDVLLRVPGVNVIQTRRGAVPVTARLETALGQGDCRLRPYVDGMAMFEWDFDSLRPDDVEAIEVYHGASAPVEYQRLMDPDGHYPCGVILVWTTRGGR